MVVERSMNPDYLSNTYLVGQAGGEAFFVDAGGPVRAAHRRPPSATT